MPRLLNPAIPVGQFLLLKVNMLKETGRLFL